MKIGNLEINGYAALAPMAGVADRAFREICREHGAAYTVGELTSAKGVNLGDKKSASYLSVNENERPMASQLFGGDPESMAKAAVVAASYNPDFIDINMGCPAPKVAGNGGGSALLRDPILAGEIVKRVVDSVDLPITVKMRIGWDEHSINAVELAKICEANGASAITVHGRTRVQMYAPSVNREVIAQVKRAVGIPVIANGDIADGKSAKSMYEDTGCDFIMVGRAAMGNPFIFNEINHYMKTGEVLEPVGIKKRIEAMLKHIELMLKYKDTHIAFLEARKHTAWYMRGIRGAAELRKMCGEITCMSDIERICEKALAQSDNL